MEDRMTNDQVAKLTIAAIAVLLVVYFCLPYFRGH